MERQGWFLSAHAVGLVQAAVARLVKDSHANAAFVIDRNGQLVASCGDSQCVDTTSLASLVAGSAAASNGLAKLLNESGFDTQFHEGIQTRLHLEGAGEHLLLAVVFDPTSSLGLVRLRAKRCRAELAAAVVPGAGDDDLLISDADLAAFFATP